MAHLKIVTDMNDETQFLPGSGRVDTAVWMHYLDAYKTVGEEARRQLHKNVASNIEQVLAATTHKAPIMRPPPSITKTIKVRLTRHAGYWRRSRDELISDVLQWTPIYGRAKAGAPTWTYIQQICEDTGCSREDQPETMNDREKWQGRVRDIRACGSTSWWWWWWWLIYRLSGWLVFTVNTNVCSRLTFRVIYRDDPLSRPPGNIIWRQCS